MRLLQPLQQALTFPLVTRYTVPTSAAKVMSAINRTGIRLRT
jgi:hypothetical protein